MELIRTRLAVSPEGTYRGMRDCVRKVLQHEGVRAFYKGLLPSLVSPLQSMKKGAIGSKAAPTPQHPGQQSHLPAVLASSPTLNPAAPSSKSLKIPKCCVQIGIIPFAGVDIATFELMKQHLLEEYHGDPPPVSILVAGMLSSSVAQFASYPLSLVRTRLQVGDTAADRLTTLPNGGHQACNLLRRGQAFWLLSGPPAAGWLSLCLAPCCWCRCHSRCALLLRPLIGCSGILPGTKASHLQPACLLVNGPSLLFAALTTEMKMMFGCAVQLCPQFCLQHHVTGGPASHIVKFVLLCACSVKALFRADVRSVLRLGQ